jgi:hypothetical protein
MRPETAVRLVNVLETLNKNKGLLALAIALTIALTTSDFGILGDENPRDKSVL